MMVHGLTFGRDFASCACSGDASRAGLSFGLLEPGLRQLKHRCLVVLESLDLEGDLIWMHLHMCALLGLERGQQAPSTEQSWERASSS
jgi:hypothetical protein